MDSSTSLYGQVHFKSKGYFVYVKVLPFIIEIPVFDANSADPDLTPHSSASDLGLHCLLISILWDARHKWVKVIKV